MTEEEAKARIARLCAADFDPQLDDDDLNDLVLMAKRVDADGRLPSDANWEPTWDFNAAAAAGWDTKAARAAGDFRFEEDNQVFHREQVFRHCETMSRRYRRKMVAVPLTPGG